MVWLPSSPANIHQNMQGVLFKTTSWTANKTHLQKRHFETQYSLQLKLLQEKQNTLYFLSYFLLNMQTKWITLNNVSHSSPHIQEICIKLINSEKIQPKHSANNSLSQVLCWCWRSLWKHTHILVKLTSKTHLKNYSTTQPDETVL